MISSWKASYESAFETFEKEVQSNTAAEVAAAEVEIKARYEGAGGLFAQAEAADTKMKAAKMKMLEELETLLYETKNIDTLTVAEMLEKNPHWQQAIEEDLKNHNWGSEIPASLKAAKSPKAEGEEAKQLS